jgi:hypothetical protein
MDHVTIAIDSVDQATDFIFVNSTYTDKDALKERIRKHYDYKTCKICLDGDGKVCAVCLWNISENGKVAHVVDMVIREDFRGKDLMRRILAEGMKVWPVDFITYDRDYTEDGSNRGKRRLWSTKHFLRRKA